ncbi:hypothetical protein PszF2a_26090 [Stutzerimonas stutzeri]|nr:hypothetical protein PszF2a_26090 [Stutzerimonas stutzeri]
MRTDSWKRLRRFPPYGCNHAGNFPSFIQPVRHSHRKQMSIPKNPSEGQLMLKDCAYVNSLYKQIRKDVRKRLFSRSSYPATRPMIIMAFFTLSLMAMSAYSVFNPLPWSAITYMLLIPWGIGLYWSRQYAIRHLFRPVYRSEKINKQPRFKRDELFQYVLFRDKLNEAGWTAQRAAKIAEYYSLMESAPKPYSLSQNFFFIFLVGLMVALTTEAIKISTWFSTGYAGVSLILCVGALYIAWVFLDGIHVPAQHRAYVRRDLQRAAMELRSE